MRRPFGLNLLDYGCGDGHRPGSSFGDPDDVAVRHAARPVEQIVAELREFARSRGSRS